MSILIYPKFKNPPQTILANVNENIDVWIKSKSKKYISQFLRKSKKEGNYKGYRFIDSEDLTETIRTEQWFNRKDKNVCIEFIFIRHYHWTDSMTPLYFSHWYTTIIMKYKFGNDVEVYQSDAQLKRFIKSIK